MVPGHRTVRGTLYFATPVALGGCQPAHGTPDAAAGSRSGQMAVGGLAATQGHGREVQGPTHSTMAWDHRGMSPRDGGGWGRVKPL